MDKEMDRILKNFRDSIEKKMEDRIKWYEEQTKEMQAILDEDKDWEEDKKKLEKLCEEEEKKLEEYKR